MPGHKTIYNENYLTGVVSYRLGIAVTDTEPPDENVPRISVPESSDWISDLAFVRIGATNHLYIYAVLDTANSNNSIQFRLWRWLNGVAYDCTPATWLPVTNSCLLHDYPLPAGEYIVTATSAAVFDDLTIHIYEQHTE
jgi:hypothetical protein